VSPPPTARPVLVDTSVWIDHLRSANAELATRLERSEVWCHPFIVGELACGNLANRRGILRHLEALPRADVAEHREVLDFLEAHHLAGRGIGWLDAHLLASARLARVALWTLDKPLAAVARRLGLA
jgi:predicted nucleic acid-binding protein